MDEQNKHYAEAQMLIRKPASEVFQAFIDPAITTKFWFTKGSGKLELNKPVEWKWEMYNVSTTVVAKELVQDQKIVYEWGEPRKIVKFTFQTLKDGSTYVTVQEHGYTETGDALINIIRGSTG